MKRIFLNKFFMVHLQKHNKMIMIQKIHNRLNSKVLIFIFGCLILLLMCFHANQKCDFLDDIQLNPQKYATVLSTMIKEHFNSHELNSIQSIEVNKQTTNDPHQPVVFVITPTYRRSTQLPDLTRLGQTLRLVPNVVWIVVEDSTTFSASVTALLSRINKSIRCVHLLGPKASPQLGRGVSNRLKGLAWIRENYLGTTQKGVIYLADDDNAYDVRLFNEIRATQRVSIFPVGALAGLGVSSPIVNNKTGRVIDFHDPYGKEYGRKFAVDMAGFAVNLQYYLSIHNATMKYEEGDQEDSFVKSLKVEFGDLEPLAANCTELLVWHVKTSPVTEMSLDNLKKVVNYGDTNLPMLYRNALD